MTVVDIHCHAFNADDLPVRGFLHRVHLRDPLLGAGLSALVDQLIQGGAPGYREDLIRLNALLGGLPGPEAEAVAVVSSGERFEEEVDRTFAELRVRSPDLLGQVGASLAAEQAVHAGAGAAGAESLADVFGAARRAVRWVKLFGRSRLDLLADMVRDFDGELDLVTPMLVDLGTGLGDLPQTTGRQQVELFEKLSRAAMLGRLPGLGHTQVHPFVGFDPLGELRARRAGDIETPLDLVREAVLRYGFVGVKVYPPMGWRPSGNRPRPGLTTADAAELDRIVDDLAGWCAENDVPITAHGADSVHAAREFVGFGSPADWRPVLRKHQRLRLNLGHFGGDVATGWPRDIARATAEHPGLYADVGNQGLYDDAAADAYFDLLEELFSVPATARMSERLMYGSDWYMVAIQPHHDRFLVEYRHRYLARFGQPRTDRFLAGNALAFLGFDDPTNQNNRRLRERYNRFAPGAAPEWLAA